VDITQDTGVADTKSAGIATVTIDTIAVTQDIITGIEMMTADIEK